jgi:hypothetical protein
MRRMGWAGVALAAAALVGARGFSSDRDDENDSGRHSKRRECSEATLRGAYGIQLQGTRPSGPPPAPIESLNGVLIRVYDGHGAFTQVDNVKGSITGIVPDREGSGTYEVNADCSGVTHFSPGPGIPPIEERLVIVDGGEQVFSMVSSPLPVMATTVQRKVDAR